MSTNTEKKAPIMSEYIRLSERRSLQIKLWGTRPSKFEEGHPMPAYVEIEEITYTQDGEPTYGKSVRISAAQSAFLLPVYLTDFLKEARRINRESRQK
jgi:hypothetical protein